MNKPVWNRWLAVGCVCVLCGILVATLWPFNPRPRNQVTWVENGNGVHLGGQGTILSSALFQTADSSAGASCSLELWAESDLVWNTGTLLGYYSPENLVSFSLSQFNGGLDLRRGFRDGEGRVRQSALYLKDAVARGGKSFIAITASGRETAIYLDGTLAGRSSDLGLSSRDLAGKLVIATSPMTDSGWTGNFRGLAIFNRELTPAEVRDHMNTWMKNGRPEIAGAGDLAGLYLFDERAGSIVHNRAGSAPDLAIPDHYLVWRKPFLEVPWKEFAPTMDYYQDLVVNIVGFMPFGFLFCAYFSSVRRLEHAARVTILLGFALSLTIEILQAYIPARGSGMTDIITNTTGSMLGAMLFRWGLTGRLLSRLGIPHEE